MSHGNALEAAAPNPLDSLRTYVEGYPQGGRIERHSHSWDQLALISHSAAIIETDSCYLVHPLMKALWLPAGVEHSVYSPRPFYLHALYVKAGSIRTDTEPQILGLDNLVRELILFLCAEPRAAHRGPRHAHAYALISELLPEARPESFTLPRPRSERARKLADYLTAHPQDSRSLDVVVGEIGGASLRTFERVFLDETKLSLAAWRRQSRLLTSLSLLADGKSIAEAADAVGYDSVGAFSTAFKQCFGMSPSRYMEAPKEP
jgi:AraC-like DNA-binding protein